MFYDIAALPRWPRRRGLAGLALTLAIAGCGGPASQQAHAPAPPVTSDAPTHPGHGPGTTASPSQDAPREHAATPASATLAPTGAGNVSGHEHHSAGPSATATSAGTATPQAAAARPSSTSAPATNTRPTNTALPAAEPPAAPQPVGREIVWLVGSGETATGEVQLQPGLLIVHIEHQAATPFAIYLMNMAGDHLALLANHTTPTSGMRAYGIREPGLYYLHVIAHDGWRAGLEQPGAALEHLPSDLSADGPRVSAPRQLAAGPHRLEWTHAGALAFEVQLLTPSGQRVAAPITTTGPGQGLATLELSAGGDYLFDVDAAGPWTLTLDP